MQAGQWGSTGQVRVVKLGRAVGKGSVQSRHKGRRAEGKATGVHELVASAGTAQAYLRWHER